jgi:hypothetical protein
MSNFTSRRCAAVFAAAIVAGIRGVPIGAQVSIAPETPGNFLMRPAVSMASARRGCLELGDSLYTRDIHEVGACAALGFASLGVVGGASWYSSLAGRRWLFNDSLRNSVDTVAESELVLFMVRSAQRMTRDTLLMPIWHYRFEPEMLRSVTPTVVPLDGGVLVSIDECVNGTGGCSQSFFTYRGGRWSVVRLSFLDSLNHRFPGAINHGFHVDPRTLRADAAVYSPGDANCCPSRNAEMRLRLRGDTLEIVELRVRPIS